MIYILHTEPCEEIKVSAELNRRGFKAYVPRRETLIRKQGMRTKKTEIIFKGYVFADMEYTAENHHKIKSVNGVIRFLSRIPLPDAEDRIMRRLFNGGEPIEQSAAYIDENGCITGWDGFLDDNREYIALCDKRNRRAAIEIKFGGKTHRAKISFELMTKTKSV